MKMENVSSIPKRTAEEFNNYFINVFKSAPNISCYPEEYKVLLKQYVDNQMKTDNFFEIPFVTEEFVTKMLSTLDCSKAAGLDEISARFLKISSEVISKPLVKIINISIHQGIFPQAFKAAKVIPIHKKGSKSDKSNYRPISILPLLSKLIEFHRDLY